MVENLTKSEIQKSMDTRLETIGVQKTIFGENINITQFKNLKEKRELKEKVLKMFKGEMIRSILTPKELDGNKRLDSIERQKQSGDRDSNANVIERADSFGKKTLNTLSVFPSLLTTSYTTLLSKEGDWVLDPFAGHNSRASNVLAMGRKYAGFDIHKFPIEMCEKGCSIYPKENYKLLLQSSESMPFEDNSFDFSITCPPYADVEKYEEIYGEKSDKDISAFTYDKFLEIYKKCIGEVYRCLKPNSFFVIVVGDVHRNGKFISISNDTAKICEEVGFTFHDENIYNRKSNIGGDLNYKTFILTCKRFPCIHEYILVFQKLEKKEPKEIKRFMATTLPVTLPVKAEVTPQAPIYKFGINTREDLAKLVNGVMLSYEGYSEIELKELDLDIEKVSKLKEILLKK
jgi:DNA modification methylase